MKNYLDDDITPTINEISNYILELSKKPVENLTPIEIHLLEMAYFIIKRSKNVKS